MLDDQAPQLFDDIEERLPFLLHQDAAQQDTKRAHIAAQRGFLGRISGRGRQFGEPVGRSTLAPQGIVNHGLF